VAEIRIEEKKRGAPWLLILLLIVVAAIIGWWLWTPSATVADSVADTTRTP
jgi:DNA-binding transcriptional regulator of glucitol operon